MIIQLEKKLKPKAKETILSKINSLGYKTTEVKTQYGEYLVCIGKKEFDIRNVGLLEGVRDVHRVSDSYKLVSKKWKVGYSDIDLGDGI
ncbi:MAG TPA: 3-deoxy-7-phosphoheptulonate synthase, partial [Bacteroidia bacterium]